MLGAVYLDGPIRPGIFQESDHRLLEQLLVRAIYPMIRVDNDEKDQVL